MPDSSNGVTPLRVLLALFLSALLPLFAFATAPAWWSQRGVLVSGANADDYAPANQGQLKNIAEAAMAEMDAKLPGGAGQPIHDLVDSWVNPTSQPNDFAPINLGQLKAVAKPFYDRLIAAGVAAQYPWASAPNPSDDFAVANIGQVKKLFSFAILLAPELPLSARLVASGTNHTLAIYHDGTVWSWGNNSYGQLGDGTTTSRWHRELVPGLSNIVAVSARGDTSVALRADGTVWAWGANDEGGVGNGTFDDTPVPAQVMVDTNVPLENIIAIAAGDSHNLALASDGTVWAWGADWGYQLADVSETDRPFARQVLLDDGTGLNGVVSIGCGSNHNFAVKSDGTVWTWGYNGDQELGTGGSDWRYAAPTAVPGMRGVVMASGGETLSVALKADGTVWSWGWPFAGQLGNGSSGAAPAVVGGIGGVTQIACGGAHTLALKNDGTVWAWGWNANGQLGLDPAINSAQVAVQNKQISGAVGVVAANNQSFAIIGDGTLIGWGANGEGTLGRPQLDSHLPTDAVWDFRLRDDADHDGLATAQEILLGGNSNAYSTAGDGISDGWKASYGLSLTDTALASRDLSGIGVTVLQAFTGGLDPFSGQKPDPSFYHDGAIVLIRLISPPLQPFLLDGTYQAMVAEARTADGVLARNVPVTFSITQGSGTLVAQPVANPPAITTLTLRTGTDGRVTAYFLPSGAGATAQATIVPPSNGNINGPSGVGGEVLDPNGDDDGDGKSNADELKLGTSPKIFNLFSETHFPGHAEAPHRTSDPMPWQFYTETLPETPADWAGLTVTARIVFDSFGTVNNWVVDDYATVNGYEFVRLNTKDLIYDVSEYWKSTGNNRFAAVSDATGGVFCAGFKLILSVEVPVEIRPDAGVEGRLGGMVLSTLGDNGEDHFVGPALLSGQTPNDQYITFVAQGIDAAVFQRLLQWEGGEDVPGEPLKRRVDRDAAVKTVLRLTSKTDNIEVTKVNVWVVEAFGVLVTNPAPGPRPLSQSNTVLAIDGSTGGVVFYALPSYRFKFAIEPIAIFDVSADVPELRGGKDTRGDSQLGDISPFSLEPLSGGATLRWDVSRRVQYRFRNPNLIPYNKLTANYGVLYDGQPIPDRVSVPFPSSAVIGNDDPKVLGEENNPYDPYRSAQNEFIEHDIGELASFDTPSLALPNSGGQEGFTFEEEDLFQEFARLQIGSNWYVISDPLPWKMIMKIKFQQGQWNDNGSTTGLGN